VHLLIKSFKEISLNNIELRIYGSHLHKKEYYSELKNLINDDKRITLMGEYNYNDLSNNLSSLDVIVFPTIGYETYGLTLTEALAHNLPVISSNTLGSALEFVRDGVNGFFFRMGDEEALARLIEFIGRTPTILNKLKKNISYPPRVEEEAVQYELIYKEISNLAL
jgi:glycosyltransferase involved in cell wall biosynthesis